MGAAIVILKMIEKIITDRGPPILIALQIVKHF